MFSSEIGKVLKNLIYVSLGYGYIYLLGYIFHFFVSRRLGTVDYGEFMVLYSLMMVVGNLTALVGTITVKSVVENFEQKEGVLRYLRGFSLIFGGGVVVIGLISSPFIQQFLKISYLPYVWLVAITWLFMFMVAVERGYLQANNRFGLVAFQSSLELTLRLLTAVALFYLGFNIFGAIFPSTLSIFISVIILLGINRKFFGYMKAIPIKKMFRVALYASPSGFFTYADDLFIRRIFDEHTAGLFASASIVGKAFIWLSLTLFSVFFPRLIEKRASPKEFKRLSFLAFAVVVLIFVTGEVLLLLIGERLFLFLFGDKFIQGFEFLPYYVIAVLPLALTLIFIGVSVSIERNLLLIYTHVLVFYAGFLLVNFSGVMDYMLYIFLVNVFFLVVYLFKLFRL